MLGKDKNSSSVYDLQAFLTPEGFLDVANPYEKIQCMVITKRVQGLATSHSVTEAPVRVPKKPMLPAPASSLAANLPGQVPLLQVEETKVKAEEDTLNETETESEEDEEAAEMRVRVQRALDAQIAMIQGQIPPGRKFRDVDELQREVVDKLNAVTNKVGLPDYFSHNGLDKPMYLSVVCTGCTYSNYLWFKKIESHDGTI